MRFKDLVTGNVVETNSEMVVEQFKKHPDRYKEVVKEEPKKKVEEKK